jgi:hypothetical protein
VAKKDPRAEVTLKLGKTPARPGAVKLKFANYVDTTVLPNPPASFGHERLVQSWPMFANDTYGDCVWAGAGHEHQLWAAEAGRTVRFTDDNILAAYSAVTGFRKDDPSTDQGTDMETAAKYRRQTGIVDASGQSHKIGAYVALEPGNVTQLWYATYLFDGVGIGVEFPAQWFDAFNQRRAWGHVWRPKMEGGHYISGMAKRRRRAQIITWGAVVPLTAAGYHQFNDETIAYLSEEKLINGKSLEGFDLAQLRVDLAQVTGVH